MRRSMPARAALRLNVCRHAWFGLMPGSVTPSDLTHSLSLSRPFAHGCRAGLVGSVSAFRRAGIVEQWPLALGLGEGNEALFDKMLVATLPFTVPASGVMLMVQTLIWQGQDELDDKLGVPAAVWSTQKKCWLDTERRPLTQKGDATPVSKCPWRVGIVSTGLIINGGDEGERGALARKTFGVLILDEAHKARSSRGQPGSIDRLLRRVFVWNGDHVEGCCYHGAFCCLICGPAANFLSIPLLARFFLLSGGGLIVRGIFLGQINGE
jgi:hypothetical protein